MVDHPNTAVADLVVKLHSNIDSIHQCIQSLSDTSAHDAELERLSTERETKIAELRTAHENALKELAAQREKEANELAEQRKREEEELEAQRQREYEELMARRRKEDEERKAKVQREEEERVRLKKEEDDRREQERLETERSLQEKVEAELERLEDEMEKKVEEGKRALRELDEKRKAINAQIDAALNTPTVIPTIHFRSRAKTLRGGQKDISKKDATVAADKSKDIPAEPETKPVDIPTKFEGSAADEAKETPVDSRAEYDHSPEESNVAVSDTSAESNAIESKGPIAEAEDKPTSIGNTVEEQEISEPKYTSVKSGTELERPLVEHDGVESNAVSMPSDSDPKMADSTEVSAPEVQEPTPEVHDHEAQDGAEPDNLKAEGAHDLQEVHASDAASMPEDPTPVNVNEVPREPETGPAESVPTSMEEPTAHHAKEIDTEVDNKPSEVAHSAIIESKITAGETLTSDLVEPTEDVPSHDMEDKAEGGGHVSEDKHAAKTSDLPAPILEEEGTESLKKKNLEVAESAPTQEQEEEKSDLDEQKPEKQPALEHIEATTDGFDIDHPSKHSVEHAADGPGQPGKKESQDTDLSSKTETSRQYDKSEMVDEVSSPAPPAVAWWEKDNHVENSAHEALSESSWPSRSRPGEEEHEVEEQLPSEALHANLAEKEAQFSHSHTSDGNNGVEQHVESDAHPEIEDEEVSEAPAPASRTENADEKLHASNIENQHQYPENTPAPEEVTLDVEGDAHSSVHEVPDKNDDHERQQASAEVLPILGEAVENQDTSHTAGHEEGSPVHVEEREMDSTSATVKHSDIESMNAPHEQEHDDGNSHASSIGEDSTLHDSGIHESEEKEPERVEPPNSFPSQPDPHGLVPSPDLHTGTDSFLEEPVDQEHDILDEYTSNNMTPREESHLDHNREDGVETSWPLPHAIQQEPDHGLSNERPATPIQVSNIFDFAPSTPQHLIQEENHYGLAESPATVLDADDLFEDDDDDEEEAQYNAEEHEYGHGVSQDSAARSPEQVHEIQRDKTNEESTHDAPETRAFFASLVDTIRPPDISLLRQLANQGPSPASRHLENDDPFVSGYSQAAPGRIEPAAPFPPQEPDAALHIRTHTADTIPSFDSYAQSDDASTPTSPSEAASSPFVEEPHDEPNIRSSWQDNSALQGSDPTEPHQELKPQASPLQAEFDPYNTQTYPNYISPKTSQVSLRPEKSPRNSFSYSGGFEGPRFSTQSSISPPPVPAKTPRLSSLNTSQASQFFEGRPYDSPISATRSHHESDSQEPSSPTPSRIPRRPTDRTLTTIRTPVSSPSIPSNSFFQKTRSLFESASQSPSTPAPTRPLSNLFTINKGSASPPRRNPSRPSSLLLSSPGRDEIIPKSLDKDGKPPSPVFTLPRKRTSIGGNDGEESVRQRNSNPFLDGLSKLVGSGGLEDSIHNPNRRLSKREKEPLLKNAGETDGY